MVFDLNNFTTLMGWNQLVRIDYPSGFSLFNKSNGVLDLASTSQVLRVENYSIGVRQEAEAPSYVTGRQDRTAWRKGPITSEGDLTLPFIVNEDDYSDPTGLALFICAAELAKDPTQSFSVQSSAHPKISGCKVNTARIECTAENPVTATANLWGIVDQEEVQTIRSVGSTKRIVWGPGTDSTTTEGGTNYITVDNDIVTDYAGVGAGAETSGNISLEQISMFDVCSVQGAPSGMFVTGFSLEIDNALLRNFTMGSGSTEDENTSSYSPFGLNATSISANQRTVRGSITWQSDYQGKIAEILGSGIEYLRIKIGPFWFELANCVWSAMPPTLGATERVTVESAFTAMGTGTQDGDDAFDALTISVDSSDITGGFV